MFSISGGDRVGQVGLFMCLHVLFLQDRDGDRGGRGRKKCLIANAEVVCV